MPPTEKDPQPGQGLGTSARWGCCICGRRMSFEIAGLGSMFSVKTRRALAQSARAKAGGAVSEGAGGAPAVEAGAAPTPADGAAGGEVAIEPADE